MTDTMNIDAIKTAGFRSGLVKAASSMDNQPGPDPGNPAPPDSHRKRNVALGAALLVGGAMGTKKLHSMGGTMAASRRVGAATAAAKKIQEAGVNEAKLKTMAKGIGAEATKARAADVVTNRRANLINSQLKNPAANVPGGQQMSKVRDVTKKYQELRRNTQTVDQAKSEFRDLRKQHRETPISLQERGQALVGGAKDKFQAFKANREKARLAGMSPEQLAAEELKHIPGDITPTAKPDPKSKRFGRAVKGTLIGGAAIGAGNVIGASAESRANQPQDDQTPGA